MTDYEKGMIRPRQNRVFSSRMKWICLALLIVNAFFIYSLWDKNYELVEIQERNEALEKSITTSQREVSNTKKMHNAIQEELEECKKKYHDKASEDESHSQELNSCKSELDGMTKKNGQLEQESKNLQEKVIPENEKLKQDVKGLQVVIEEYKKRESDEKKKGAGDGKESLFNCQFNEDNMPTDKCKFDMDDDAKWSSEISKIIEQAQVNLEVKSVQYRSIDTTNTPEDKTPHILFQEVESDQCLHVTLDLIFVNSGSLKLIDSGKEIASFPAAEEKSGWHEVVAIVTNSSATSHKIVLEGKVIGENSAVGLDRVLITPIECPKDDTKKVEPGVDEPVDVDKAKIEEIAVSQ